MGEREKIQIKEDLETNERAKTAERENIQKRRGLKVWRSYGETWIKYLRTYDMITEGEKNDKI